MATNGRAWSRRGLSTPWAALLLVCAALLAGLASADLTTQPRRDGSAADAAALRRRSLLASAPTASKDGGLQLPAGVNGSSPVAVSQALQADAPLLSVSQLLSDLTPRYNASAALDRACAAIHAALPADDYFGRAPALLSQEYVYTTTHYYNARQAANHPACIIYPTSAQDVATIMKTLRQYDVTYAVKAAGHSTGYNFSTALGFSSTTGVLIDMGKMRGLAVQGGVIAWEPGYNWGDLATALLPYNVQVAGGRLGAVGPGLSLGGGISWYTGKVGLASDTTTAFDIVLPSGQLVHAAPGTQYEDLWYAAKVGIGSYGIVTKIYSKAMPGGQAMYGGSVIYPTERIEDVLGAYADWINGGADACPNGWVLPAITDALVESVVTRLNIFEFFYDGTDPGDCFKGFNAIPTLYDDRGTKSYPDFLNKALTNQKAVFSGFNNQLYSAVTDLISKDQLLAVYRAWEAYALATSGEFLQSALSFSVITRTGLAASRAAGGNAITDGIDEGFLWVCYVAGSIPAVGALTDQNLFGRVSQAAAAVPKSSRSLPLYGNYATVDQKPFLTYNGIDKLRAAKKKYDPAGFVTSHTTGQDFY